MNLAIRSPATTVPARPGSLDSAAQPWPVGPGWEVLLMPSPLTDRVVHALGRATMAASALGWVFSHAGQRGVLLPEQSDTPAWPPGTTYLRTGESVTLPPFSLRVDERDDAGGWMNLDGPPLSKPLLLHPIVTAIAAGMSTRALPSPES
ncbi:hypothetical protein ACFYMW_26110 [Streptomyces sp. NPDC006692]|uniref:hypothetical protein n=1 Tax=unclassified Streptomyces TaxID=2593676 RepID=UPI0034391538